MRQVLKDLLAMTVAELKEELEARGECKSGNKSWLRRRLHAAILRDVSCHKPWPEFFRAPAAPTSSCF